MSSNVLSSMRRLDRTVVLTAWWTLVMTVVASGLLLTVVRLMLPEVENYRSEVASWVSTLLKQPVSIGTLRASWHGWTPELRLENVRLLSADASKAIPATLVHFADAVVTIDPLATLQSGELRAGEITVGGALLAITRKADGSFVIEGMEDANLPVSDTPQGGDLARWLLRQNMLSLHSATILWTNGASGRQSLLFTDVGLRIRNAGNRHQIEGTLNMPKELGKQISFALDITGDLLTPAWSGEIFLHGKKVDAGVLRFAKDVLGIDNVSGPTDFEIWTDWKFGNLSRAQGKFELRDVRLGSEPRTLDLEHGRGAFTLEYAKPGWDLNVEKLSIRTPGVTWPDTSLRGRYVPASDTASGRISGSVSRLPLGDFLPNLTRVLGGQETLSQHLDVLQLEGLLRDLQFAATIGDGEVHDLRLITRIEDVDSKGHGNLPTLRNLSGRLEAGQEKLLVTVASGAARFPLTGVLPQPLDMTSLQGNLIWSRIPDGWQVETRDFHADNPDLSLVLTGTARWQGSVALPDVSLVAKLARAELTPLPRYLPIGLIPKPVTDWIATALTDGEVRSGEIVLHGNLADFPFRDGNGVLDATVDLSLNSLAYARGWPELKALRGQLFFQGRDIRARVDEARIFGTKIDETQIDIAQASAGTRVLKIHGKARGPTQDAGKFLSESPIGERFRQVLEHLTAEGESDLTVRLALPLGPGNIDVDGTLSLRDSVIDLPGLARGLEQVNGDISFDHGGIRAEHITASYLDNPMDVRIENITGAHAATRIQIFGRASKGYLARHMRNAGAPPGSDQDSVPWLSRVTGGTQWAAQIDVPHRSTSSGVIARVQIESDLVGAALDLPYPFGKQARQRTIVQVDSEFERSGVRRMSIRYGAHATGEFEFKPQGDGYRLTRGAIGIGSHQASLPRTDTVQIAGYIDRLDPAEWLEIVRPRGHDPSTTVVQQGEKAGAAKSARIEKLDLRIGELVTLGSRFQRVHLSATKQPNSFWKAVLSGGIRGEILIPPRGDISPIRANIERLDLNTIDGLSMDLHTIPQNIPAIEFRCEALRYNDIDLGLTTITTEPRTDGMHIKRLHARSGPFEALANGEWTFRDGRHQSKITMDVNSGDLGQLLSAFGYAADQVEGGTASIQLEAQWDGRPMDFDLKRVKGLLHFKASEGTLVKVKRGATGRIFGLLSVTSLPRRLSFDFSDLFGKGLKYDRIQGSFSIERGNAYTNNLFMDSAAATVEISGRTGLVSEDYDQLVTVTPKLSSSLPFAPIWLVEKVIDKRIFDKVFAHQYTITGNWKEPVIEPVPAEENSRTIGDNG